MIIIIPLMAGRNYISFPATSSDNFGTIFTSSEIIDNIQNFFTYDPILGFMDISYLEYIEKGRGYVLDIASPGIITYDGVEYTLTFEQLRTRILEGWNLIGPGYTPIIPPSWCRVIDAKTVFSVFELEPNKAYWISYYNCKRPTTEPFLLISMIGLGLAMISLLISLRGARL